jgi:hypothetical protein
MMLISSIIVPVHAHKAKAAGKNDTSATLRYARLF